MARMSRKSREIARLCNVPLSTGQKAGPTLHVISDNFPPGVAGKRCKQSGIIIPDSKSEYRRRIAQLGFHQESPSDFKDPF